MTGVSNLEVMNSVFDITEQDKKLKNFLLFLMMTLLPLTNWNNYL